MRSYASLSVLPSISGSSSSSPLPSTSSIFPGARDANCMSTPSDIQTHLYHAFLNGRTPDVALRVRGTWEGVYKLHRVVLIQAGFFRSLFDGGFREASGKQGEEYANVVNVTFDDPNITRSAFEICISRLYGGGPPLHLDPLLIPSRRSPLTPSFSFSLSPSPKPSTDTPVGNHPATPRFLLSLLATALYLSIPSLVSQAIRLVLKSLGPHTVIRYLNFAIGKGVGERAGEGEREGGAVGLEQICQEVVTRSIRATSVRSCTSKRSQHSHSLTRIAQIANGNSKEQLIPVQKEAAPESDSHSDSSELSSDEFEDEKDEEEGPVFMYGTASNKIGEAAACWLCRWGADMLTYEEALDSLSSDASNNNTIDKNHSTLSRRRATESNPTSLPNPNPTNLGVPKDITESLPRIWRRRGMSASWVRAILSSDAFFVRDEKERYDLACRAVELRRRDCVGVDKKEEREWDVLFGSGIHYMHMSLDDLIAISQSTSPTTGRPYAPASVIQAAHWNQSVLRHHITYRPNSSSPSMPPRSPAPAKDGCLGLAQMTEELAAKVGGSIGRLGGVGSVEGMNEVYYPVPIDSSSRIGDTAGLEGPSMETILDSTPLSKPGTGKNTPVSHTLDTYFGILTPHQTLPSILAPSSPSSSRVSSWAPFPPIRFGVEFWGLDTLAEKARLTSQTVWYAGSLFNVYVQVVRKKGVQLGMYLHRLSSVETIPAMSAPPASSLGFTKLVGGSAEGWDAVREREREGAWGGAGGGGWRERRHTTSAQPVNIPIRESVSTPTLHRPASRGAAGPSRSTTPVSAHGAPVSYSPPSTGSSVSPTHLNFGAHNNVNNNGNNSNNGSGIGGGNSNSNNNAPRPPPQPYRDPREAVRAHFTLICASPTGGAATRFASAPDAFHVGRSWGWKSSALQTEELVDVDGGGDVSGISGNVNGIGGAENGNGWGGRECSLRATVVLGVV